MVIKPGEIIHIGNYCVRNFKGYFQSREGDTGPWQFYVCGFGSTLPDGSGVCSVLMADESKKRVPIDARSRITIEDRRYGPARWDH